MRSTTVRAPRKQYGRRAKMHKPSVALMVRFFARREERQILLPRLRDQDDTSFRAKRRGGKNLLLVAAIGRAVILMLYILIARNLLISTPQLLAGEAGAGA